MFSMHNLTPRRSFLGRAVLGGLSFIGLALGGSPAAFGQEKVRFETVDGVTLRGNLYTSDAGSKAPTIIMLHPLTNGKDKKPGDQTMDGWQQLAADLHKAKYTVLTFDFRGHGESTAVSQQMFQKADFPHNTQGVRTRRDMTSLAAKDMQPAYLPHLVDDVSAARVFLDGRNDRDRLNSSNLIVLGAGDGATIGALWMASEWKRRRADVSAVGSPLLVNRPPVPTNFGEPEGRDLLAGIFISMSPTLGGRNMPINNWIRDITAKRSTRTQLLFVYGGKDPKVDQANLAWLKAIRPGYERTKEGKVKVTKTNNSSGLDKTEDSKIDSKEQSVGLLPGGEVAGFLIKTYLPGLLEGVVLREPEPKENKTRYYYWVPEVNGQLNRQGAYPAKYKDEEALRALPIRMFGLQ